MTTEQTLYLYGGCCAYILCGVIYTFLSLRQVTKSGGSLAAALERIRQRLFVFLVFFLVVSLIWPLALISLLICKAYFHFVVLRQLRRKMRDLNHTQREVLLAVIEIATERASRNPDAKEVEFTVGDVMDRLKEKGQGNLAKGMPGDEHKSKGGSQ